MGDRHSYSEVLAIAHKRNLLEGEHFSVDGTMIQAWAGRKSIVRKEGGDGDDSTNCSTRRLPRREAKQ